MTAGQLNIKISPELQEELETLAHRRRMNLSALCRQLMESSLQDHPGRLLNQLTRALDSTAALLTRAQDEDLVEDVEGLVEELDDLRDDLKENPDSDDESDTGDESKEEEDSDEERT